MVGGSLGFVPHRQPTIFKTPYEQPTPPETLPINIADVVGYSLGFVPHRQPTIFKNTV